MRPNNIFIYQHSNKQNWPTIDKSLNERREELKKGKQDFKAEFSEYKLRGPKHLSAYWFLVNAVVVWDKSNNGFGQKVWHEYFKREAGLTCEFDNMNFWEIKYKNQFSAGAIYDKKTQSIYFNGDYEFVGPRFAEETRSISKKGDVTKQEMSNLIEYIHDFGGEKKHNIPDCFLINQELDRLLKFYD